jgi:hypothetical protein
MFFDTDIIKMLEICLTTYLLCLMGVFFNRQSEFLGVPTVIFFSKTCSFIRMRHIYTGASQENQKEANPIL